MSDDDRLPWHCVECEKPIDGPAFLMHPKCYENTMAEHHEANARHLAALAEWGLVPVDVLAIHTAALSLSRALDAADLPADARLRLLALRVALGAESVDSSGEDSGG